MFSLNLNNPNISLLTLGIIIIFGSLVYCFRDTDISIDKKLPLSIILIEKPTDHHFRTSAKFYDYIVMNAIGFNNSFIIENFEFKASDADAIVRTLKQGDTIQVWVDEINNTESEINVYALKFKNQNYINVNERNRIKSRYNKYGLIITIYGTFLIIYLFFGNRIKLTLTKALILLLVIIISIYRITK